MTDVPARVTVSLGYTMNIGNFESIRLDFGFSDNVRSDETPADAAARARAFADEQLNGMIKEAKHDLGK